LTKILTSDIFSEQNGQYDNLDQDTSSVASDAISDCIVPSPLIDIPGSTLGLGSLVEVDVDGDKTLHGVIRWIGQKTNQDGVVKMATNGYGANSSADLVIGVELDEPCIDRRLKLNLTDGVYNGQRCFRCPERRAVFVAPKRCTKDRRFPDDFADTKSSSGSIRSTTPSEGRAFGADCPIIEGSVPALSECNGFITFFE
jgi:CAP-Gly domain